MTGAEEVRHDGPGDGEGPEGARGSDAAGGTRRLRVRIAAAALLAAGVLVALVLVLSPAGGPTAGATRTTIAGVELAGTAETRELLADLPQDGTLLGDPAAPVTIHEFADLKCPACQAYELQVQPGTIRELVRPGRANLRIHFINVIDPGQGTTDGAGLINAAYALAAKDQLWSFLHVLFFNQGPEHREWADERRLRQIAAGSPGVDPVGVSVRATPATRIAADGARRLAQRLQVGATPTVFVEPRGTARFARVENPYEDLAAAVDAATRGAAPGDPARSVAR